MGYITKWSFAWVLFLHSVLAFAEGYILDRDLAVTIQSQSPDVLFVGSSVGLQATGLPEGDGYFYRWRFAKKPESSEAFFSTPFPSETSFVVDQEGFYVVELLAVEGARRSEATYRVFSAIIPSGEGVVANREVETPFLCALTFEFVGCEGSPYFFSATPGDYSLNITNKGARQIKITLNSDSIDVPSFREENGKFSLPVSLLENNRISIDVKGGSGSSVEWGIVDGGVLPSSNDPPAVGSTSLTVTSEGAVSKKIIVQDSSEGQSHFFEILNEAGNGLSSFDSDGNFYYTAYAGIKGEEKVFFLVYDDGSPSRGLVSSVTVNVTYNSHWFRIPSQVVHVPVGASSFRFPLHSISDPEGDPLSLTMTGSPRGNVSCFKEGERFTCEYNPPPIFSTDDSFGYRLSDGIASSRGFVTLRPIRKGSFIKSLSVGYNRTCTVFQEGNFRCWGWTDHGSNNPSVGDKEEPILLGDRDDVGINTPVEKIAIGQWFSCALLKNGKVRCWGIDSNGELGGSTLGNSIDFATSLKVIDIISGTMHSCALFEGGVVKCWGAGASGRLGYGDVGNVANPADKGFLDLPYFVEALFGGENNTCALVQGGRVVCWGNSREGVLGVSQEENIGDDETLVNLVPLTLSEKVEKLSLGNNFACALLNTGLVSCWGNNRFGQVGAGSLPGGSSHVMGFTTVDLGEKVIDIASGEFFACAVLEAGSVRCWGQNRYGQLGLGHTQHIGDNELPSSEPTLALLESPIMIGAGRHYACSLMETGKIYCWGDNRQGELGLAHTDTIGNDEDLGEAIPVNIGGRNVDFFPRFNWGSLALRAPATVNFDASQSYAKKGIASYAWDFGGGATATGSTASHRFENAGEYTVTLTLTDDTGATSSLAKKVRVLPANLSPFIEHNQSFEMSEGGTLSFTLDAGRDWESDALTYSLVDAPSVGTLTGCLGGADDLTCTYAPPMDFTGEVVFSYKANDGNTDSLNAAQVTITVASDEGSK